MTLKIDNKECDQCGTCISVCPGDALVLTDSLQWREKMCTFCTHCIKICPFGAISSDQ